MELLVIDSATDEFCRNNHITVSSSSANVYTITCPDTNPYSDTGPILFIFTCCICCKIELLFVPKALLVIKKLQVMCKTFRIILGLGCSKKKRVLRFYLWELSTEGQKKFFNNNTNNNNRIHSVLEKSLKVLEF